MNAANGGNQYLVASTLAAITLQPNVSCSYLYGGIWPTPPCRIASAQCSSM